MILHNDDSASEPDDMSFLPYVRTSVADPGSGAFLTPGSGIGKKNRIQDAGSGSRMINPSHISESLETNFLG